MEHIFSEVTSESAGKQKKQSGSAPPSSGTKSANPKENTDPKKNPLYLLDIETVKQQKTE